MARFHGICEVFNRVAGWRPYFVSGDALSGVGPREINNKQSEKIQKCLTYQRLILNRCV